MKVLIVCYDNPFTGRTGVSTYCRDLLPALVGRGIETGVVCVERRDWRLRPYLHVSDAGGVTLFTLVNSPLDPENSLYRPAQDCVHAAVERVIRSCLQRYEPGVLHVQTLQGYPGSIVSIARALGIPTLMTLHDFWALCPRLGLMRLDGAVCDGPEEGRNCLQHCVRPRPWPQRLYRFGNRLPDGHLHEAFQSVRALHLRSAGRRGSLWTPARHVPAVANPHLLSGHAQRSTCLLQALRQTDGLLAVSEFVKAAFVRHGLPSARIRTLPPALALEHITWIPRTAPETPLRIGFLGRAVPMKGAHIFAEAVREVPAERARFLMYGGASPETRRYLQQLSGQARLEIRGSYTRDDLPRILDGLDVVVVPSLVQETVGLVVLEAQAAGVPVIASRIGAIPEHVRDGENGLLCAPGDPADLAAKIRHVVETPSLVAAMSARTRPSTPLKTHVDMLLDIYTAMREKGGKATWTPSLA
jgi:glycosyltransferase involved in cell wall biosynthesis